jgi:signal transduction histidine kinase
MVCVSVGTFHLPLLLATGLIYWLIRSRKHKEQARLRMQEHIHAEQLGEAKTQGLHEHQPRDPYPNDTHSHTSAVSLIKEDKNPYRKSVYKLIKRNAERILHLINQMMDLRKIDKGTHEHAHEENRSCSLYL